MRINIVKKLMNEAMANGGSFVEYSVSVGNLAFVSNSGGRKSTRNYKLNDNDLKMAEKTLKNIDDRSLLFSGNVSRIKVSMQDGRETNYIRKDNEQICIISGKKYTEVKEKEYTWIRFVDRSDLKCGVAFEIKEVRGHRCIHPCNGSIHNGPFMTGITTDLLFVISGEFNNIPAKADDKHTELNVKAAKKTAAVLKAAIGSMLPMGFLGMPLFGVLPCTLDDDSDINMELVHATKDAFNDRPCFKSSKGTIVNKRSVILGSEDVTRLFPQDFLDALHTGKNWCEKCESGSREEYFLIDIGVQYYDRERFLSMLSDEDYFDDLSTFLSSQRDKWLREFYCFCSAPYVDNRNRGRVTSTLMNIRSIRDSKGKMRFPHEVSILSDASVNHSKAIVVKNTLIYPDGSSDEYSDQIFNFFINDLSIGQFSVKAEMEQLADDLMKRKQPIDRQYCEKLATLARFDVQNRGQVDFSDYAIFPYESTRGIRRVKANDLVIGKPYIKEGNLLSNALGRETLWKGLKKLVSEDDLKVVIDFAVNNGAVGKPVIQKQRAENHISFTDKLYTHGKQGKNDSSFDYVIPGLNEILKRRSVQLSKMVWNGILETPNPEEVLFAEYSVDNRRIVKREDSSLIKILRERTWIPSKDGKFYMPGNIELSDISDEFIYDKRNPILKQLNIGSGIKEKKKNIEMLRKMATREGLRILSEEEYQEYLKWKQSKNTNKKRS